jgi:trimethylamine-N-oxide reductase (cytochrome c)
MAQLSRRNFLAAAVAGSAAAVAPVHAEETKQAAGPAASPDYPAAAGSAAQYPAAPMPQPEIALSETFSLGKSPINEGECITATRWGIVRPQVRGGKMVSLKPFEFDYAPTPNINGLSQLPYSPSRIRYPMVRESYLKDGVKSRAKRGTDRFVRVSWEKALDLVAGEINRVYRDFGPSAVFGRSYGWMSTGKVNAAINLQQRLLNLCGGFIGCANSYSTAAIGVIMPYVVGAKDPRSQSWDQVIANSERVVLWGCDPLVTNDVDWLTPLHNAMGYFRGLKAKGTKTIAINPIYPDTAEYLGSDWIAPKPGTDCALMLGMIYELEATGKADHAFIDKYVEGWPKFMEYVSGKTDGVKKTPEWAEKITGIPAAKIRELTHELQSKRTMIMMGWGIQRIQYGEQSHWMGFALASALGQIGLPGGGIGTNYQYSSGGAPQAFGPFLGGISSSAKPARDFNKNWKGSKVIPVARFVECFLHPGKTIDFNGTKVTYPEVKLVMWAGGNPFAHQPQTNKLREAWMKPETVVVTDTVWTATARHADIVLPAATVFEHNDITNIGTYSNDGLVAMQQAIAPQYESKSDYQIFSELADKLGIKQQFTEGLDEMGWIKKFYNEARERGAKTGVSLPSFEDFWKKGYFLYDVKPESRNFVDFAAFRQDPDKNDLNTESGKIQIYSPKIAGYGYKDCLGYPSFIEPTEYLNNRTSQYPLALMACKSRYRMHSQLDGTVSHDFANIEGREPCWIHPENAKERGIKNGDIVAVTSPRGTVLAGAYVTDRIRRDVVVVHHGAWYDPVQTKKGIVDVHGNSNTLTMDVPTSSLACGNIASSGLVQVRKYTGELPSVHVYDQPRTVRS